MSMAAERFARVNEDLSANQQPCITVGLAKLGAEEGLEDLIGRADEAMYENRRRLDH